MHRGSGRPYGEGSVHAIGIELTGEARSSSETAEKKEAKRGVIERFKQERARLMEGVFAERIKKIFGSERLKKFLDEGPQWVPIVSGVFYGLEGLRGKKLGTQETVSNLHRTLDTVVAGFAATVVALKMEGYTKEAFLTAIPSLAVSMTQTAIRRLSPEKQKELDTYFDSAVDAARSRMPDIAAFVQNVRMVLSEIPEADDLILLNLETMRAEAGE